MIKNGAGCGVYCIAFSASLSMHSFLSAFVLGFVFVLGGFLCKADFGRRVFRRVSLPIIYYSVVVALATRPGLCWRVGFFPFRLYTFLLCILQCILLVGEVVVVVTAMGISKGLFIPPLPTPQISSFGKHARVYR